MPNMQQHESNHVVKTLVLGDSGSGKTGALASLVDAGLNLRILDFDNGLSVLRGYVKDKSKLANVHYATLKDDMKLTGKIIGVQKAHAFQEAMDALEGDAKIWGADIPPAEKWTPHDVLVIDSLSKMGRAALFMVMQLSAAGFKSPELQHYGIAMENLEKFIDIITSDTINCHVIVNTHTTNVEGTSKLYPEALGSKLPPKIGKSFDNMISLSITGSERTFKTQKDGILACKTASPINPTYPISTGLADIFKTLTGKTNLLEGLS